MDRKEALRVLKETSDIFHHHKVNYWLCYGMLLGAYREHDFIKGEGDIDICCESSDNLNNVKKHLSNLGWGIYPKIGGLKLITPNGKVKVDLCIFEKDGKYMKRDYIILNSVGHYLDGVIWQFRLNPPIHKYETCLSIKDMKALQSFIKMMVPVSLRQGIIETLDSARICVGCDAGVAKIPYNYIYPLKTLPFHGKKYPIPNKPEKYLELLYGDWRTPTGPDAKFGGAGQIK